MKITKIGNISSNCLDLASCLTLHPAPFYFLFVELFFEMHLLVKIWLLS